MHYYLCELELDWISVEFGIIYFLVNIHAKILPNLNA